MQDRINENQEKIKELVAEHKIEYSQLNFDFSFGFSVIPKEVIEETPHLVFHPKKLDALRKNLKKIGTENDEIAEELSQIRDIYYRACKKNAQ
jgi:hypothetical protein